MKHFGLSSSQKQYKSSVIKNHKIEKRIDGVSLKDYAAS